MLYITCRLADAFLSKAPVVFGLGILLRDTLRHGAAGVRTRTLSVAHGVETAHIIYELFGNQNADDSVSNPYFLVEDTLLSYKQ